MDTRFGYADCKVTQRHVSTRQRISWWAIYLWKTDADLKDGCLSAPELHRILTDMAQEMDDYVVSCESRAEHQAEQDLRRG